MKFKQKDKQKSEQNLILNLDLSLEDDFLEIGLDAIPLNEKSSLNDGTEISARCVFVTTKTTLPAPHGRRN